MTLLLIEHIISKTGAHYSVPLITVICIFLVTAAVFIDLISGINKAKMRGEDITSDGRKRTVSKLVLYYSLVFLAFFADELIVYAVKQFYIFPSIPILTIVTALYIIIGVEWRSVREKADDKTKKQLNKDVSSALMALKALRDEKVLDKLIEISKENEK